MTEQEEVEAIAEVVKSGRVSDDNVPLLASLIGTGLLGFLLQPDPLEGAA